ncbi:MAG: efflux RND transporter periplasmic adaptor subunit [Dysgonomonas sp.]
MKINQFLCGISILLFLVACSKKNENNTVVPHQGYPVMKVSKQRAILESVYPATIKGQEDIEIRPRLEGFINAIYVDEGAIVKKGQVLFKIDSPESEEKLAAAEASLYSAQADLNTARVNVERIKPLAEKNIVSNTQLLTYENAYKTALARLKQSEATLKSAQATMSWVNVTSPVDGVVGTVSFRIGSLVSKTDILTTVASTGSVFAYFSLNENELKHFLDKAEGRTQTEKIKNLPPVSLRLSDESLYSEQGKIQTISGIIDISTGSANFRAEFPNHQGKLRSGASGKVIVPEQIEEAIIIPQKATFAQQDKILVYKVQSDSVKQTIILVTEMPDGKSYVVTDGLLDGDLIVSDGIATLNDGKKISIKIK